MLAAILLCASLGLDTLAVSLALGIAGLPRARWLSVGLTFALCEGLAPIIGLLLGSRLSSHLALIAGMAAGALLLGLGLHKLASAAQGKQGSGESRTLQAARQAHGWRLLLLGLSVSLDNLAIGFTLGTLALNRPLVIGIIAVQALLLTGIGLLMGQRLGDRLGSVASLIAGGVLSVLGLLLLVDKGLAWLHLAR